MSRTTNWYCYRCSKHVEWPVNCPTCGAHGKDPAVASMRRSDITLGGDGMCGICEDFVDRTVSLPTEEYTIPICEPCLLTALSRLWTKVERAGIEPALDAFNPSRG